MKTESKLITVVVAAICGFAALAETLCTATSSQFSMQAIPNGSSVSGRILIQYSPLAETNVVVSLDGRPMLSSETVGSFYWEPQTLGNHTLTHTAGKTTLTCSLNVTDYAFAVTATPNPPMAKNNNVSITPPTRSFPVTGGGGSIVVSGSGTWTAAVSDPWIVLNTTSGSAGYPVAYQVDTNTNVEERIGYVYVSGWVHTITQEGQGGSIDMTNVEYEYNGGTGSVIVTAPKKMCWHARPNVDWLSVTPTSGIGDGEVTFQVAPLNDVTTRSGTLTIAGETFTVFQYGRRIKLSTYRETRDYETHVIPITVDALAVTQWSVTPNNSWISIVDGGNGRGSDLVSIAIGENPSYKPRTGTVTIGTETFTVTQEGSKDLEFAISPTTTTASVRGANGLVQVTATPDLPWTAVSQANWLTIYELTANGAGNGNVVYSASPNPSLSSRTGKIKITPEAASGLSAKYQTVTQPAAVSALSLSGYEFEAAGESCPVEVTVDSIVQWTVSESLDWITVNTSSTMVGPGTVTVSASENTSVYPRSGTITIAGHKFAVSQKARGVEVEYDNIVFDTDGQPKGGGVASFSVHPDGNSSWTAVSSDPTWITIYWGASGTGDGEIEYSVAPYVGDGAPRTGWIQVGDKKVYITQRGYDLNINPYADWAVGNAGAGEIAVSAPIDEIWTAIATEPWITVVSGYDRGTGSGIVRFTYTDNDTGKPRSGKIVIAGEAYTLTQQARVFVNISGQVDGHGMVDGADTYVLGTKTNLTAVADSGYEFTYWTLPDSTESMQNPLPITVEVPKTYTAHFSPLTPEFASAAVSDWDGVGLRWTPLAWATEYRIYRAPQGEKPGEPLVVVTGAWTDSYVDRSGVAGTTYWYWIEAVGETDMTECKDPVAGRKRQVIYSDISYQNLQGATHSNPTQYIEGKGLLAFAAPDGGPVGYSFDCWSPASITEDRTGTQTITANWKANGYSVDFSANGGDGTMDAAGMTYDTEKNLPACRFTRTGYGFAGWATTPDGGVVYANGAKVVNLASEQGATVTLYAKWRPNEYTVEFKPGPGEGAMDDQEMTYDEEYALYANLFRRTGYTFAGWALEDEAEEIAYYDGVVVSNLTDEAYGVFDLYAVWTANTYSISFDRNGGSGTMSALEMTYDSPKALTKSAFTKTGYTFAGWALASDGEILYADRGTVDNLASEEGATVTLYAKWAPNGYRVVFNANGGEGEMSDLSCRYDAASTLSANAFTRDGYAFVGWARSAGGNAFVLDRGEVLNLSSANGGSVTLYAVWQGVEYSVRFNPNGGAGTMEDQLMVYGEDGSLKPNGFTAQLPGRHFAGWATSPSGAVVYGDGASVANLAVELGAVVDLYAVWVINNYRIRFDGNGGTGSIPDMELGYDVEKNLSANGFVKPGYCFVGWAKSANGNVVYTDGGKVRKLSSEDGGIVRLYAIWQANEYAVVFNPGIYTGGQMDDQWMTYDVPSELLPNQFVRNGYTFAGWAIEDDPDTVAFEDGEVVYNLTTEADEGVNLYAVWEVNTYSIVFNANGGSGRMQDETMSYGSAAALTANVFRRTGYDFAGWALTREGPVKYADRAAVKNLAVEQGAKVTLYAQWSIADYSIVFNANGGSCAEGERTRTYGMMLGELPVPTWEGHDFEGWYTAAEGGDEVTEEVNVTTDMTLYARWHALKCAVSVDTGNGADDPIYIDYGTTIGELPVPQCAGYVFDGWMDGDGRKLAGTETVTGDMRIRAGWRLDSDTAYAVWFLPGTGSGQISPMVCDLGKVYKLPADGFTPPADGMKLVGWIDGKGTRYDPGVLVFDLAGAGEVVTLTAVWE